MVFLDEGRGVATTFGDTPGFVRGRCKLPRLGPTAPPFPAPSLFTSFVAAAGRDILVSRLHFMLSGPAVDLTFDDDEWIPSHPSLYRAASVGSWGVTSIGRGFDWGAENKEPRAAIKEKLDASPLAFDLPLPDLPRTRLLDVLDTSQVMRPVTNVASSAFPSASASFTGESFSYSPAQSRPASPFTPTLAPHPPPIPRSPTMPQRPRRRSSQQRVSLIAGRVSIATLEPSSPQHPPPSPTAPEKQTFLGGRDISEFVIEGEIGRGAYGLVKRGREIGPDGSLGPPIIIKQIIKSRILADCWKKHPKHGTIPIEIYVMSSISQTTYILPRVGHGIRSAPSKVVNGHPNICPLLDFFEDNHYYYLVLPSTLPEQLPDQPSPASDLFDLVENFPQGLPPFSIRSYLGQIADALAFLHSRGIVHRDIKDENVVLAPDGKCILIDFGSSGLVKRGGWDTFSGTLDYAGPEILRGERYEGKEQDVWAFGVVAYVLLVGECPFMTPAEAQDGLQSPFANASISLDERCGEGKERDGAEPDGGGALEDAAALSRFLAGGGGWGA
ncbi:kinase-like domain-containing protein [Mycena rosella]|uniref:Kinase-like domain-containing protein n=1 Tax=Mycena rosella TaxID=1033263 RepID=A0AAD7GVH5_MYCRO|nr:kinase-like domain-containing protein [Mycena rosella]